MVCKHQKYKEIYKFNAASLYKCDECNLVFSKKHWEHFDPKKVYEGYYRNEIPCRFSFLLEHLIKLFRFFRAFKIFSIYPRSKSVLDIGSGRGFLLYYLKKCYKYRKTVGIQISKNSVEYSRNKLGLEIFDQGLLKLSFDDTKFDVITMWHVLEHVSEPERYIERIYDLLDDKGKLIIEVPNFNSWTRALTNMYWLGLDLDYHITFFTPETLMALLCKHRFVIKKIHTFSLEYSIFISVQSLVSLLTKSNHLVYRYLQVSGFSWRLILHVILFVLLIPFCSLVNILLCFSKRGEVILVIAEKNKTQR